MKKSRSSRAAVVAVPPRRGGLRTRPPRAAKLTDFAGIISNEEAEQMIRDIEEAFEKVDAE